jgi:GTPase
LAIVGKPNVGKSSLCNCLLGEQRMIVSEVAGTTVDAVDTQLTVNGKSYILVDTAGLRKSAKRKDDVEILSAFKSQKAIGRADIVLLVIDGLQGPSEQDAKILENILENHKGVVVVANKSDLAMSSVAEYRQNFREKIAQVFHFFPDVIVSFVSAKTGYGIDKLFDIIDEVHQKLTLRLSTSELNNFFFETIRKAPAPVFRNKDVKFFYLTQTHQMPPSFIAFANFPEGVTPAYRRFLAKQVAERWGLKGIPIRIFVLGSRSD